MDPEKEIQDIIVQAFFKATWVHKYIPLAFIVNFKQSEGTEDPGNNTPHI